MRRRNEKSVEWYALVASVLLHIVFLVILFFNKPTHQAPPQLIEVTIEPPAAFKAPSTTSQTKQIVSPSEAPQAKPPDITQRLSEQDTATEVEKIKRGDGGGNPNPKSAAAPLAPPAKQAPPSQDAKPEKSSPQKETTTKQAPPSPEKPSQEREERDPPKPPSERAVTKPQQLTNLRLDTGTLEEKFGKSKPNDTPSKSPSGGRTEQKPTTQQLSQYQAFNRPPGSGAAFLGSGGLSDYLPNLPDGDITLLNAKANQYAGFVRRVAIQVFTELRSRGWDDLTASEVRRISDFTTVEAVLSRSGKLLSVTIERSSGSQPFDGVLLEAAQAGARDPNPPPGAVADDGLIHFVFKARSWTSTAANPRSGALRERRWLLLATGLK